MPYIKRVQSMVNHTDACSTGNKEVDLSTLLISLAFSQDPQVQDQHFPSQRN